MAPRVPKAELPPELRKGLIEQLGVVPEPVEVLWHNPKVAEASQELSVKAGAWELEYAEAMTTTPTTVTDELSASLLEQLGPAALVELTVFIGFANMSTRCNTAHGITSQGYYDACEIPLAPRPERSGVASRS